MILDIKNMSAKEMKELVKKELEEQIKDPKICINNQVKMPNDLCDEFEKHSFFDVDGNSDKGGEYVIFSMMQRYDNFYDCISDEENEPNDE